MNAEEKAPSPAPAGDVKALSAVLERLRDTRDYLATLPATLRNEATRKALSGLRLAISDMVHKCGVPGEIAEPNLVGGCLPCPDCGEPLTPYCANAACPRNIRPTSPFPVQAPAATEALDYLRNLSKTAAHCIASQQGSHGPVMGAVFAKEVADKAIAAFGQAPAAERPMTWTREAAETYLVELVKNWAVSQHPYYRNAYAALSAFLVPETSEAKSGEAVAEPAQPTYRELNQTGALMAVPPGEGSQPEPAEVCHYTPTGWEQYPRKEWKTDCGLEVTHNTEAWDGEKRVPVSHGDRCMKCKRKPVDALPAPIMEAKADALANQEKYGIVKIGNSNPK